MKKISIIFIIVICLLTFTRISYSEEEYKIPGVFWNSLIELDNDDYEISSFIKEIFIRGVGAGVSLSFSLLIIFDLNEEVRDLLKDWNIFIDKNADAIIGVMDSLYSDPANKHIKMTMICFLACEELIGFDIKPLLRRARIQALQD
jgi:hypothetical protein